MLEEVETEYIVRERDYINFQMRSLFNWKLLLILGLIFLVLLINTVGGLFLTEGNLNSLQARFLLPFLFPAILFFFYYYSSRSSFRKNEYFQNKMRLRLLEYRVQFIGQDYNSIVGWNKIYKLKEKKNYFLFYTHKRVANIVSKDGLSGEDVSRIREYVQHFPELRLHALDSEEQ